MKTKVLLVLILNVALFGGEVDELLEGFDDAPVKKEVVKKSVSTKDSGDELLAGFDDEVSTNDKNETGDELLAGFDDKVSTKSTDKEDKSPWIPEGLEGRITQSLAFSYHNSKPHDGLNSLKSLLFLEYNKQLPKDFKLKINANAFYDAAYAIEGRGKFSDDELDELESEVELFDAFVEGSLSENLDIKLGRQVVVWGKSDTIRVVDVLNPLDNRRPAMVDIEDLRLPEGMVKFDYYRGNWRFSPMVILEQRFNKNPPFGGDFNPLPKPIPHQHTPNSPTYALDIGGEFSGFDINLYLASIYAQDELGLPLIDHSKKMQMAGVAFNYINGSWLFKGEFAYKKDFRFLSTKDRKFDRFDSLLGLEYKGIADTMISYDISNKHMSKKAPQFEQDSYQHALRITSDFLNATLHANYLISLFGEKLDEGGFQRAWVKYDIADAINTNIGIVDYIGGNSLFDAIEENDMLFMDVSYSF